MRDLAKYLKLDGAYEIFYKIHSLEVHSLNIRNSREIDPTGIGRIHPIRNRKSVNSVVQDILALTFHQFIEVVRNLFPDHLDKFHLWYNKHI
jgi:hypothetical protein